MPEGLDLAAVEVMLLRLTPPYTSLHPVSPLHPLHATMLYSAISHLPLQSILLRRVESKKARDFVAADALREEALQLGLLLNDRQRTFESVDGGFLPSGDLPQGLDVAAVDPRRRTRRLDGDTAHSTLGRLRRQASGRGASAYSGGAPLVAPAESQTHKGDN